jgi:exosortase A-associated hydrolase 2
MVVPPFGDEMNKSRRMLTEMAKGLNSRGVAVVIPDLHGTGDSEGSFGDASWQTWISDVGSACDWAEAEGLPVRGLLAVRTGALLAAQHVRAYPRAQIAATVLWQPVASGRTFVKQLLRIRAMAGAVDGRTRETVEDLRARIANGETIVVAGFALTASTIEPLNSADLAQLAGDGLGMLHSIEVTRLQEKCGQYSENIGSRSVRVVRFLGEPYWNATEIVCDMNVVSHTVETMAEALGALQS